MYNNYVLPPLFLSFNNNNNKIEGVLKQGWIFYIHIYVFIYNLI